MRKAILVLGMHRSGTSALTRVLSLLGAALPKHVMPPIANNNEAGFWEPERLAALHDELLASAGSRWDDWRAFNDRWHDTPIAAQFKARANQLLDEEFGDAPLFVFKDPRNCRFARFWLDIFAERGIVPKIVLPVRSPLEVAQSHRARDGFPLRKGLLLWLRHVLDAEAASRDLPRAVIEYDAFLKDWRSSVATMERALGAFPANPDLAAAEIDRFLRDDLKHQRVAPEEFARNALVHAWVEQTYTAMRELARNPGSNSACAAFDRIRTQFDEAATLFGGVLADAEASLAEAEQRLREADQTQQEALTARIEADRAREEALVQLTTVQQERDAQAVEEVVRLREKIAYEEIAALHNEYQNSTSWKLTAPLREAQRLTSKFSRICRKMPFRNTSQ